MAKRLAQIERELMALSDKIRECVKWHKDQRDATSSDRTYSYHEGAMDAQKDILRTIETILN